MNSTLIDLPREIIREIALFVNAADTIALRQVHRSFFHLPVRLTAELPGLNRIDAKILMRYPEVYSFMGFDAGPARGALSMVWFFKLHGVYPGYNNIRQLEINVHELRFPLPQALEELIITSSEKTYTADPIDLSSLKRLRVLKCLDDGAEFINLPDSLVTMEVDHENIPDWEDVPRGLRQLTIQDRGNRGQTTKSPKIDFMEFPELEDLEVFIELEDFELPEKLKRVSCAGFTDIEAGHVSKVVMERPDPSIPWNPMIHLVAMECDLEREDLSGFMNLVSLNIHSSEWGTKLPHNLTSLTIRSGESFNFRDCSRLERLCLKGVNMEDYYPFRGLPSSITHLDLERIFFPLDDTHIDFSSLPNLVYIKIGRNQTPYHMMFELVLSCDLSKNHKLEKLSLTCIKIKGAIPRSVTDIYMRECDLNHTIVDLDGLKSLILNNVQLADSRIPPNLETLKLADIDYPEVQTGLNLSNLRSLKTLSLMEINILGDLPDTITDLSIVGHLQNINLAHLYRLTTLSISSWAEDEAHNPDHFPHRRHTYSAIIHLGIDYSNTEYWNEDEQTSFREFDTSSLNHKIIGPLPTSLRHLNLARSTHRFDLLHLTNLETLNIRNRNHKQKNVHLPPSIKLLITNYAFSIEDQFLPNLREHRQVLN